MRASSRPCSFFAAWYSKFSERSPNARAVAIASTAAFRCGPFHVGELRLQRGALRLGQLLALEIAHAWNLVENPAEHVGEAVEEAEASSTSNRDEAKPRRG